MPPEWHAWIHRITDVPPNSAEVRQKFYVPEPQWAAQVQGQKLQGTVTGTDRQYKSYSTVPPKHKEWTPTVAERSR